MLLELGFRGEVHHPDSPGYDAALRTWGRSPRGNLQAPLVAVRPRGKVSQLFKAGKEHVRSWTDSA